MTQHPYSASLECNDCLVPPELPGEGQRPDKMQGHWVLARVGKRVLRPGGIQLTRRMLDVLAIGPQDCVIEFAPGLGVTSRMVLRKKPFAYWGVEREPAAVEHLRRQFVGSSARVVSGKAEESRLPGASASVVYGEALLSMQSPEQKNRIIAEAYRLLAPGGRYGIHELCLLPDDIPDDVRREIQAEMSREIHVGVQALCAKEWMALLQQNGLTVTWCGQAPMHLLRPHRLLQDEGLVGSLRITLRVATKPELGSRVRAMRRLFDKYGDHLGAISLVARRA